MSPSGPSSEDLDRSPLPVGTVTMLLTDIEGSTRMLQELGDDTYGELLAVHHRLVIGAGRAHRGQLVDTHGDAVFMVFTRAYDGLAAAVDAQRALAAHTWPVPVLRVRMGLHAGTVELRGTGYVGAALHVAARVADAANGGQVLLTAVVADLVGDRLPELSTLVDLGMFGLRDVERPIRLLRVRHHELPENDRMPRTRSGATGLGELPHAGSRQGESASARTVDAVRGNLPLQPTPLVGREREIAVTRDLLRRTDVRLVTLTGPGGTGKTRVALQAATEVANEYASGACFVALAPVVDPDLVSTAIAQALDVQAAAGRSMRETVTGALRERNVLLVLDNFEQVVAAAGFVADLLAVCPLLKVLVTSRVVLHLYGEHDVDVPSLALPADLAPWMTSEDTVAIICRSEAVQLFEARASAATADFGVTAANAEDIAQICRRLDGLPLAIELAAARIRSLSPKAILSRLDQRLPLLTGGPRDLPERLQTMRKAIAWSYEGLDSKEQTLFRRISVFVGGCTLAAGEAVAATEGGTAETLPTAASSQEATLDVLASLVDSSVIRQDQTTEGEPRFWMLETLREYGLERLEASGEAEDMHRRHAAYFLAFAEQANAKLAGSEQLSWYERLEKDHDNLRAALAWSQSQDSWLGLQLAGALAWFWRVRSHLYEGRRWLETALAVSVDSPAGLSAPIEAKATRAAMRIRALNGAGLLAFAQTDHEAARGWFDESLGLARGTDELQGAGWAMHGLGRVAHLGREPEKATAFLEESAAIFRQINDMRGYAYSLFFLAASAGQQQNADRAAVLFEESLSLLRPLNDTWGLCGATGLYSQFALVRGDLERSAGLNGECLAYARDLKSQWMVTFALWRLAYIAISRGEEERGVLLYAAAQAIGDTIGVPPIAESHGALVRARAGLGRDAYAAAWKAGGVLPLDAAIAEGLDAAADLAGPLGMGA